MGNELIVAHKFACWKKAVTDKNTNTVLLYMLFLQHPALKNSCELHFLQLCRFHVAAGSDRAAEES